MTNDSTYKIRGTKVTSPYPPTLTPAETRLVFSLQKIFDPTLIFPDCYLPKPGTHLAPTSESDLTQIDCIALGEQGIFVFESKDLEGWIYGRGDQIHWTAVFDYGKEKHRFYNPVKQNNTHVKAVQTIFPHPVPVFSMIVFGNDSILKQVSAIPATCHLCHQSNLRQHLANLDAPKRYSSTQLSELKSTLYAARINPTNFTRLNHIAEITAR